MVLKWEEAERGKKNHEGGEEKKKNKEKKKTEKKKARKKPEKRNPESIYCRSQKHPESKYEGQIIFFKLFQ